MLQFPTDLMQSAQWRMATALTLGVPPDAGPRNHVLSTKGEAPVPELYDWVIPKPGGDPAHRCAIGDVVSWFLGILQQFWIDVGVRCPACRS